MRLNNYSWDGTVQAFFSLNSLPLKAIHRMKEEVATATPGKPDIMVEYMHLDLSSFDSTRLFVTALTERNHPLHILINNAGISWVHYGECH